MKFITDGMLGKLTRWLRLAGQDVVCINDLSADSQNQDEVLLNRAAEESRVLITRDVELHRRSLREGVKSILLEETDDVAKQLAEVSESVEGSINVDVENSRCSVCNGELISVEGSSIADEVPEPVLTNNDNFWRCKECGKIYWSGGHWENIDETIRRFEKLKG